MLFRWIFGRRQTRLWHEAFECHQDKFLIKHLKHLLRDRMRYATRFSTLRINEPSFDIIKNKKKGGGRENTFLVILLYVFLRLTNPTPEKSTVGSRWVLIKLQSENKKQTVYDYTWPTCKRMSGSQVMGNCVGRGFFFSQRRVVCAAATPSSRCRIIHPAIFNVRVFLFLFFSNRTLSITTGAGRI